MLMKKEQKTGVLRAHADWDSGDESRAVKALLRIPLLLGKDGEREAHGAYC